MYNLPYQHSARVCVYDAATPLSPIRSYAYILEYYVRYFLNIDCLGSHLIPIITYSHENLV